MTMHSIQQHQRLSRFWFVFLLTSIRTALVVHAQPAGRITCSTTEQFTGLPRLLNNLPAAAPLRGNVGCVDLNVLDLRTLPVHRNQDAVNIFGPNEAGFTSNTPGMACLGENSVPGGVDTNVAEHMVESFCGADRDISILDACGGHAVPYHYHERMSCLYTADAAYANHSTRIGTAGDGNGIYGPYIEGGILPTDLDACGGRFGVTPDSNGETVYYYPITAHAPFSVGCYGPVASVEECRALYPDTCGSEGATVINVTTVYGTGEYTLDCPCFDANESNVLGQQERPGYLAPLVLPTPTTQDVGTIDESTNTAATSMARTQHAGGFHLLLATTIVMILLL